MPGTMSLDGSRVMTTVGVIGAGRVGASCARAIVRDGLVTRLTIYDRTESYAQGEVLPPNKENEQGLPSLFFPFLGNRFV